MNLSFKNKLSVFTYILLFVFSTTISFSNIQAAQGVPTVLSYQGKLTDSGGNPLGGGGTNYYFKFSIWDNPTPGSGTKLWPSTSPTATQLTVRQGTFSVDIGDDTYPDALNYNFNTNSKIYLQVEVSGDGITYETLAPRSAISSSAFSQVANSINGTADSSFGTTTPFANTLISALSTAVNKAVMTIKGAVGQVANLFNILDSNNNSLFTVTAGGNVGVGTSTPVEKLVVNGNANFAGNLFINSGGSSTANVYAGSASDAPGWGGVWIGSNANTHTVSNYSILSNGGGMFFNAASGNNVYFRINNSDKAVITSAGNLGIGTSSPATLLHIYNTSNASASGQETLRLTSTHTSATIGSGASINFTDLTFPSNVSSFIRDYTFGPANTGLAFGAGWPNASIKMVIDGSGNVGVGTSTPSSKLSVVGTSTMNALGINTVSGPFFPLEVQSDQNGPVINMRSRAGGNVGFQFSIADSSVTTNNYNKAGLFYSGDGSNFGRGSLFLVNNNTADNSNATIADARLAILSGGNVGIGTTTPGSKLDVWGNLNVGTSSTPALFVNTATGKVGIGTTTPSAKLEVYSSTNSVLALDGYGTRWTITSAGSNTLWFQNSTTGTNNMRLTNTGLGVMTGASIAPAASLHAGIFTSGVSEVLRLTNAYTATNGTGASMMFNVNRTTSGLTNVAGVAGLITDVTDNAYKGALTFYTADNTTPVERMRIDNVGNVGIGTTTPSAKLAIAGTSGSAVDLFTVASSTNARYLTVTSAGGIGFGTGAITGMATFAPVTDNTNGIITIASKNGSTQNNTLTLTANQGGGGELFSTNSFNMTISQGTFNVKTSSGGVTVLTVNNSRASVGIGTTTPNDKLQVIGDIRVGTSTSNGCIKSFDGTGIIGTCSSDERLKTDIADLSDGMLDKLVNLKVVTYRWNDTAKDLNKVDTSVTNYGLIAQNVEQFLPDLVSTDSNGYKQVNYSRIPLYLLKSVQELSKKVAGLFDGSAQIKVKELCIEDVCVTKQQLQQMLQNQNIQPVVNTVIQTNDNPVSTVSDATSTVSTDNVPTDTPSESTPVSEQQTQVETETIVAE